MALMGDDASTLNFLFATNDSVLVPLDGSQVEDNFSSEDPDRVATKHLHAHACWNNKEVSQEVKRLSYKRRTATMSWVTRFPPGKSG